MHFQVKGMRPSNTGMVGKLWVKTCWTSMYGAQGMFVESNLFGMPCIYLGNKRNAMSFCFG